MFDLSTITNWLKLSAVQIAAVLLFTGFLMFAPDPVLERLGLLGLVSNYRAFIALALVGSAALLVAMIGREILGWAKRPLRERLMIGRMRPRLQQLTRAEKDILRPYVEEETRTRYFELGDGVVEGLVTAGILYSLSPSAPGGDVRWAYNIQPWAWDYLNRHAELLEDHGDA